MSVFILVCLPETKGTDLAKIEWVFRAFLAQPLHKKVVLKGGAEEDVVVVDEPVGWKMEAGGDVGGVQFVPIITSHTPTGHHHHHHHHHMAMAAGEECKQHFE